MNRIFDKYEMAGVSVSVFCGDGLLETVAYGTANNETVTPMREDTRFRIASISKLVTAIAVMQLNERGVLPLDGDLSELLGFRLRNPSYPDRVLTPRMLLSHTATLQDNSLYSNFLAASVGPEPRPAIREALTAGGNFYLLNTFLEKRPGEWFHYTNLGYGLLGTMVEMLSGERFDLYVKRNILEPLAIGGGFNPADLDADADLAVLYRMRDGQWVPQADQNRGQGYAPTDMIGYRVGANAMKFGPQGSLRISTTEMSRIMRMLMNGGELGGARVLAPESVEEMIRTQWIYEGNNGDDYSGMFRRWGLGIHLAQNVPGKDMVFPGSDQLYGHPGEAYGLVSSAYVDSTRDLGFVFATNGVGTGFSSDARSAYYTVETDVFEAVDRHFPGVQCQN